jgi:hypothetical protein
MASYSCMSYAEEATCVGIHQEVLENEPLQLSCGTTSRDGVPRLTQSMHVECGACILAECCAGKVEDLTAMSMCQPCSIRHVV